MPRELDALLMAALSKSPDARPRDAFSFAASLRNLKRRVDETRLRESTESRVTAAAVLSPASTPRLSPRDASSVARASSTSPQVASARIASPRATLVGLSPRALSPAVSQTSPFPSSVVEDARARVAPTNSNVGFDTIPTPQHGTQPLPAMSPHGPRDPAFGEADTEIQWPLERPATASDGPQVRSLPAFRSHPPRRASDCLWHHGERGGRGDGVGADRRAEARLERVGGRGAEGRAAHRGRGRPRGATAVRRRSRPDDRAAAT